MKIAGLLLSLLAPLSAATYHLDCASGNDSAAGTSPQIAWRTIGKASATTYQPGDALLLRRGTRCAGMLTPQGSGTRQQPIRLSSYGEGSRPVIDGGTQTAAIQLVNQQGWEIEQVDTTGGSDYGVHITRDTGTGEYFRLRNMMVREVHGKLRTKASGLIAITANLDGELRDVEVDGVITHHTTQWAGVIIRGASRERRIKGAIIRNTIAHDIDGDGLVLFNVEDGLIEHSAAWLTGLQPRQTIGTPNGIWTWRCRRCTVRHTEGFFIDSPGIDGGVYDIDWGNDDNVVEGNYGHDAQGYCLAVFAASGEVTTNSSLHHNVCVHNGRSPKLARRQGDVYLSTWDKGLLDGMDIHHNTFLWQPPLDAPLVQMDHADFTGTRPNRFHHNVIITSVPEWFHASAALTQEQNVVTADQALLRGGTAGALPAAGPTLPAPAPGRWTLRLSGAHAAAQPQLVFLEAALAQWLSQRLTAEVTGTPKWPLERVQGRPGTAQPALLTLVDPTGKTAFTWQTLAHPAELGLLLRQVLGPPRSSPPIP